MNSPSATPTKPAAESSPTNARAAVLDNAANELVFAVVGHAGSGTSTIANALRELLSATPLSYDVEILRARDVIQTWAKEHGKELPAPDTPKLQAVGILQDRGDDMRKQSDDYSSVARALIASIRVTRAKKLGIADPGDGPVSPDGKARAYILDSIRHPSEVELLRHLYQDAFILIGIVCDEDVREGRLAKKYPDAGVDRVRSFMKRDAKAPEKHGQRVGEAFHLADLFLDNTIDRFSEDGVSNQEWTIVEQLGRLIKIVTHSEIVRPETAETAMSQAAAAAMRSACLSRQVGAALTDSAGNVIATGSNEVPRAGGGVYGEAYLEEPDHRCAFRRLPPGKRPYCSNTTEQNNIVDVLVEEIKELKSAGPERKRAIKEEIKKGGVGDLIEFSRAVHAEMDALLSAAREGISTIGSRLYVTTFPCHYCARHIVSAGVDEVQYIEPYPKSRALRLHSDAITRQVSGWLPPSQKTKEQQKDKEKEKERKVLFRSIPLKNSISRRASVR